jgi:hypothetical protein
MLVRHYRPKRRSVSCVSAVGTRSSEVGEVEALALDADSEHDGDVGTPRQQRRLRRAHPWVELDLRIGQHAERNGQLR